MFHLSMVFSALTKFHHACTLAMVFMTTTLLITDTVQAGVCWRRLGSNGRCQSLLMAGMSREECCRLSAVWSPHDPNALAPGQLFLWDALTGGAPDCQTCHASCDSVQCGTDKRCRMKSGVPQCVCAPDCSAHHARHRGQQCGSDGVTYRSKCSMLKHNCRTREQVRTDYIGECQTSCQGVQCELGQTCVTDQHGLPHCVRCFTNCPEPETPSWLCGSNGVSYPSICHMRSATCLSNSAIVTAYAGRCQDSTTCEDISCGRHQQCLLNVETLRPQCMTCDMDCAAVSIVPVCGNDGITYPSWCELRRTACEQGVVIQTRHNGACEQEPHLINNRLPALEIIDETATPADHPAELPALI